MSPIRIIAAAAAFSLSLPVVAAAAEAVRIQPTVTPIAQSTAKSVGAQPSAKPADAPRIPGPVIITHMRRNADGTVETWCSEKHDHVRAHAAALRAEQQR
jgi:hypothetical protein